MLFFAAGGYCLFYKRLERGTFRLPQAMTAGVEIEADDLGLLLQGIDLAGVRRPRRWRPQAATG